MSATVRYRPDRDSWCVFITVDGERTSKSFGPGEEGRRKAEEFARALEITSGAASRFLAGGTLPIDRVLRDWLAAEAPKLSPSWEATAHSLIEQHLILFFGARDLRLITVRDVEEFARIALQTRRRKTIQNAVGILRRVCELHVEAGLLKENVAKNAGKLVSRLARRQETEAPDNVDSWTGEERTAVLELAKRYEPAAYPALLFLFDTGARRGEALGLQWQDVDFTQGRIRIRRARVRGQLKAPKTDRARTVPMSPALIEVLAELGKREAFEDREDVDFVFRGPSGKPWDEANLSRAWRRLQRRFPQYGIRRLKLHAARHTFASLALSAGKSVRWVAEVLGHSDPSVTLRVYAHALPADGEDLGFLAATNLATNSNQSL